MFSIFIKHALIVVARTKRLFNFEIFRFILKKVITLNKKILFSNGLWTQMTVNFAKYILKL